MTCLSNSESYWENTCSVKSPLLGKNRRWGNTISKTQAGLKQGVTPASSPGFKERAADGQRKCRGAWSCSDTSRTSVACWHCPAPWPAQLCCFQLSQAHRHNTTPVLRWPPQCLCGLQTQLSREQTLINLCEEDLSTPLALFQTLGFVNEMYIYHGPQQLFLQLM